MHDRMSLRHEHHDAREILARIRDARHQARLPDWASVVLTEPVFIILIGIAVLSLVGTLVAPNYLEMSQYLE